MTFLFVAFIALLAYTPQVPAGWPRFVYILGLFSLATCIVVWNGRARREHRDVRTTSEWEAERRARSGMVSGEIPERVLHVDRRDLSPHETPGLVYIGHRKA